MGHIDVNQVGHTLPDGLPLLDEVSFRVGEGSKTALIGANGAGKSTLLRLLRGESAPQTGAVTVEGEPGVMPQFVGHDHRARAAGLGRPGRGGGRTRSWRGPRRP